MNRVAIGGAVVLVIVLVAVLYLAQHGMPVWTQKGDGVAVSQLPIVYY